jgi:general secretion pathway protein J
MQDFSALSQAKAMELAGAELGSVEDVWLTYLVRENEGSAPQWVERWESETRLPLLIRIQVRFSNGADWPEFVVAPMLTSEIKP